MKDLIPFPTGAVSRIAGWIIAAPFLAAVGAAVAAAWLGGLLAGLLRAPSVWRETLRCPAGHDNETVSRWQCARCAAEYAGWVGRCEVCGDESAAWFPCERCDLAIRLPWR